MENEYNEPTVTNEIGPEMVLLLWFLIRGGSYKTTADIWSEFAEEIQHHNRFFPRSRMIDEVGKMCDAQAFVLPERSVLYRGRNTSLGSTAINELFEQVKKDLLESGDSFINEMSKTMPWEDAVMIGELFSTPDTVFLMERLTTLAEERGSFLGLPADGCDAPINKLDVSAGRINPEGIVYLYAAQSEETAVMEVRPSVGGFVNIAEIETVRPLRLFDLYGSTRVEDGQQIEDRTVLDSEFLSELFSRLTEARSLDYVPTQYICEFIKTKGFDGIRYRSSVCKSGADVVLFDTDVKTRGYRVRSSKVVFIEESVVRYNDLSLEHLQHLITADALATLTIDVEANVGN